MTKIFFNKQVDPPLFKTNDPPHVTKQHIFYNSQRTETLEWLRDIHRETVQDINHLNTKIQQVMDNDSSRSQQIRQLKQSHHDLLQSVQKTTKLQNELSDQLDSYFKNSIHSEFERLNPNRSIRSIIVNGAQVNLSNFINYDDKKRLAYFQTEERNILVVDTNKIQGIEFD